MPHSEKELIALAFAKGVDNRSEETKLGAAFARAMVNIDLNNGVPSARAGYSSVYADTGIHSLWSHPAIDFALFVQNGDLYYFGDNNERALLRSGMHDREMSYAYAAGRVYYSNGVETGSVTATGIARAWGLPTPPQPTSATVETTGGLDAGEYLVTLTYVSGQEESGAADPVRATIPQGGGITLSGIATPADSSVTAIRVYMSDANDPRLFHIRDLAVGMPSVTLGVAPRGRLLDSLYLAPFAASEHLLAAKGRIFGSHGRVLRWTESMRYGLYAPSLNYMVLPQPITAIAAADTADFSVFIGTATKTYLLRGDDVSSASLTAALHSGIVPGSTVMVPHEALNLEGIAVNCPVWMGTNGLIYVGTPVGALALNKKAATTLYSKVAVLYTETDSSARFTMAGRGGRAADLSFKDKVTARVIEMGPET